MSHSTSPLVIQEIQTSNQDPDPLQSNSLDKKAMKKNAKNGKNNKFKKLNSDYSLNNNLNKTDITANLTGVNTNSINSCSANVTNSPVTNFAENTPLQNLTNNSKIILTSPSNKDNESLNNMITSPGTKSKTYTPLTNGSFGQLTNGSQAALDKNDSKISSNYNDKNTALIYVNSVHNSQITNSASPLTTNPNYRSKNLLYGL